MVEDGCPLPEPEISPNVSRSQVQLDPSTVQIWARSVLFKYLVNTGTYWQVKSDRQVNTYKRVTGVHFVKLNAD